MILIQETLFLQIALHISMIEEQDDLEIGDAALYRQLFTYQ